MKLMFFLATILLAAHLRAQDARSFSLKADLELERDIQIPIELEQLTNRLRIWKEELGPNWRTEWPQFQGTIVALQEEQKATLNILHDLKDTMLMAQKTKPEMELRSHIMEDKQLTEKYGDLWDRIGNLAEERGRHEARVEFYSTGGLTLLDAAMNIVRSCDPNETKEGREQAIKALERYTSLSNGHPISDNLFGRAFFVDHLDRAHSWLRHGDPLFNKVFGGKSGEEFLEAVYGDKNGGTARSLVAHAEQRDRMVGLGWNGILKSQDPAIVAARELVILMRENKRLSKELIAKEGALHDELGRAFFEVFGREVNITSNTTNTGQGLGE